MFKKWHVDNKVLEKLFHERQKGVTISWPNEFVYISFFGWCSFFLFYDKKKWPLTEEAGWWMAERDDFKRGYWSRVEIPTGCKSFFSLIFVYKVTSMNSYIL